MSLSRFSNEVDRAATSVIWLSNEVDFSVPVHPLLSGEFEFIEAYRLSGKCVKSDAACVAAIRIVNVLLGGAFSFAKALWVRSGRFLCPLTCELSIVICLRLGQSFKVCDNESVVSVRASHIDPSLKVAE